MAAEIQTFDCHVRLPEWRLHLAHLSVTPDRDLGNVMDVAIRGALASLRRRHPDGQLESDLTIRIIREQMRRLGVDPLKTPPCSESLLRRFLAEKRIMRGSIAWEFFAILTAKSAAPWAVIDRRNLEPPLVFRSGRPAEVLPDAAGAMSCEGLPVLADQNGVKASPWAHPEPTVLGDVQDVVFVCFLPKDVFRTVAPKSHLGRVVWMTWAYRFVFERTFSF